jgi:hypothetical protein
MYSEFYRSYLDGIPTQPQVSEEGFVATPCPFHDDKKPSAGFNPQTGVFNCFKCGAFSPAKFLVELLKIDWPEADSIVDDYRKTHSITEKVDTFIHQRVRSPRFDSLAQASKITDYNKPIIQDYIRSRGLTEEVLQDLGVGWLPADKTHWKRESLVFVYYVDGHAVGIRYRDNSANKGGEPGCHFTLWGLDDLDQTDARIAILCEGESDRLRTHQVVKKCNFPAIVVSTATAAFKREWSREFEGYTRVVMLPHADEASIKMVRAAQEALGEKLVVQELPWRRKQVGNDVCDWMRYHEDEELVSILHSACGNVHRVIMCGDEFEQYANKPRRWLIEGLLARRQIVMIAGQPKCFKTWLALNFVRSLLLPDDSLLGIPELNSVAPDLQVLFIEEEGDSEELFQRANKVLAGTNWRKQVHWAHHLGVRLDESAWGSRLDEYILKNNIDVLIVDPFRRLHSKDENSATEMADVWHSIHRLTDRFPHLSIIILHHFTKAGVIADGWNAFRGSSTSAAEVDLGIFVEKRPRVEGVGIKIKFDGRSIPNICGEDGKDVFKLGFTADTGLLVLDTCKVHLSKHQALMSEMEDRGTWSLQDCAKFFGVTTTTVDSWVKRTNGVVSKVPPSPGRPSSLCYNPEAVVNDD